MKAYYPETNEWKEKIVKEDVDKDAIQEEPKPKAKKKAKKTTTSTPS